MKVSHHRSWQLHNNKVKETFYARNVPESPVTASLTISQEKCPACCPQITLPIAAAKGRGRGKKNPDGLLLGNIPPLSSEAQPILLSLDISKEGKHSHCGQAVLCSSHGLLLHQIQTISRWIHKCVSASIRTGTHRDQITANYFNQEELWGVNYEWTAGLKGLKRSRGGCGLKTAGSSSNDLSGEQTTISWNNNKSGRPFPADGIHHQQTGGQKIGRWSLACY